MSSSGKAGDHGLDREQDSGAERRSAHYLGRAFGYNMDQWFQPSWLQ